VPQQAHARINARVLRLQRSGRCGEIKPAREGVGEMRVDDLDTEEDMTPYHDASLDEDPGDGSLVHAALDDIARARGMSHAFQRKTNPGSGCEFNPSDFARATPSTRSWGISGRRAVACVYNSGMPSEMSKTNVTPTPLAHLWRSA